MPDPDRRPPGRPRLDPNDPSTPLTVRIRSRVFDRACKCASTQRIGLSTFVRRAVLKALDDARPR